MDPNAALEMIRDILSDEAIDRHRLGELADAWEGLDEWLSRGGFMPEAWQR